MRLGALSFTAPLVLYHGTGRGWTMLEHDIRPSAASRIDERAREHGVTSGPTIFAEALVNLAANEGALTGDAGPAIARWYVAHGVDGAVERSRGYAGDEDWVILWNMRKIRDHRFLAPREDPAPSPRILAGLR